MGHIWTNSVDHARFAVSSLGFLAPVITNRKILLLQTEPSRLYTGLLN